MNKFASLWVGKPLTKIQWLSLSSFVHHGHEVVLYVYDNTLEVPQGIIKRDAREIYPESDMFTIEDSYAPFSDIFRYKMIKDTGYIWIDTDILCLSSDLNLDSEIFFVEEAPQYYNQAILKLPQDLPMLDDLVVQSKNFNRKDIVWIELGPGLLTKLITKYNLEGYAANKSDYFIIDYLEFFKFWEPEYRREILYKISKAKTATFFNHQVTRSGLNKNILPRGSAIEYFYKKMVKDPFPNEN